MSIFGKSCDHRYRPYQGNQYVCSKCGQVKVGGGSRSLHVHQWRGQRGNRRNVYCVKCGASKVIS